MYRVGEFEFATEEEARNARKEAEGIKYIKSQTNMDDPNTVLKLYGRLIQKEVFVTPVGYAFLREMQMYLQESPFIEDEDIVPLPEMPVQEAKEEPKEDARERRGRERAERRAERKAKRAKKAVQERPRDYRTGFLVSTFCAVVFAVALIGMFVIAALSKDNVNIINYENALIDKYELWEQELNAREAELDAREAALSEAE